jgi:hypothetical protein
MEWNKKKKKKYIYIYIYIYIFKNILSFSLFGSLSRGNGKTIPLFESLSEGNRMKYSFLLISSKPQIFIPSKIGRNRME